MSYSPWRTLRDLPHLTYARVRLPAGRAWWLPDVEGIALDDRLGQTESRCALEHELQHAAAGDECLDGRGPDAARQSRRQERRADQRAARRLAPLDLIVDALLWSRDDHEVADHLWIDEATWQARKAALTPQELDTINQRLWAAEGEL